MTAEQRAKELHYLIDNHYGSLDDTKSILIEFAQYHVKECIKNIVKDNPGQMNEADIPYL